VWFAWAHVIDYISSVYLKWFNQCIWNNTRIIYIGRFKKAQICLTEWRKICNSLQLRMDQHSNLCREWKEKICNSLQLANAHEQEFTKLFLITFPFISYWGNNKARYYNHRSTTGQQSCWVLISTQNGTEGIYTDQQSSMYPYSTRKLILGGTFRFQTSQIYNS
jgi:hypothetical protein